MRKFFDSIHHEALLQQLGAMFKDEKLLSIFAQIIQAYEASPQRGLPIGNLTSQYFANHYLTGLDHYIKEQLQMKAYVRYMDDMVLWHQEKAPLKEALKAIEKYLNTQLQCELKPVQLNKIKNGLPFLGYHIFPHHIGLLQKSKQRFIQKMNTIDKKYWQEEWTEGTCGRRANSLLAFIHHANAEKLNKNLFLRLGGQSS